MVAGRAGRAGNAKSTGYSGVTSVLRITCILMFSSAEITGGADESTVTDKIGWF